MGRKKKEQRLMINFELDQKFTDLAFSKLLKNEGVEMPLRINTKYSLPEGLYYKLLGSGMSVKEANAVLPKVEVDPEVQKKLDEEKKAKSEAKAAAKKEKADKKAADKLKVVNAKTEGEGTSDRIEVISKVEEVKTKEPDGFAPSEEVKEAE